MGTNNLYRLFAFHQCLSVLSVRKTKSPALKAGLLFMRNLLAYYCTITFSENTLLSAFITRTTYRPGVIAAGSWIV